MSAREQEIATGTTQAGALGGGLFLLLSLILGATARKREQVEQDRVELAERRQRDAEEAEAAAKEEQASLAEANMEVLNQRAALVQASHRRRKLLLKSGQ
jgi:hypothetical protein